MLNDPSLQLRLLTHADLPFADSVRQLAGWNQTIADWERFLAAAPEGCFVAEWNGTPAGTATTIIYGPTLAWIGMVLVHPNFRRRGLGRSLLQHCIDFLHGRGVHCIKLDATPAGKLVYAGLGFQDEWTFTRWEHVAVTWSGGGSLLGTRATCRVEELENVDTAAFGISRRAVLEPLLQQSSFVRILDSNSDQPTQDGNIAGYGLMREGASALYLGPVVATSLDGGVHLLDELLASADGRRVIWDVPDLNSAAVELAKARGFTPQRSLTRMFLGENATPGDPKKQFALAGPEVG